MTTSRLTPEKWIAAGFETLQDDGPNALAAEPLARRIGATKGSFYWHFKDVPAFHRALLTHWQKTALTELSRLLEEGSPADKRLRQFGQSVLSDPVEPALRVWAHHAPLVAEILSQVDMERLKYLGLLLNQRGLRNPQFARAMLACLVGLPQMQGTGASSEAFEALVDTVLALA